MSYRVCSMKNHPELGDVVRVRVRKGVKLKTPASGVYHGVRYSGGLRVCLVTFEVRRNAEKVLLKDMSRLVD